MAPIVELENLKVYFYDRGDNRFIRAVENVGFSIREGSVLGLVGESGCGKTVTALSMMGLINSEPGVVGGKFFFKPKEENRPEIERALTRGERSTRNHRREDLLNLFYGLETYVHIEQTPFTIVKDTERWLRRNDRLMEYIRGENISMIFQNPRQSLNPFVPVGIQLEKTIRRFDRKKEKREIREEAIEYLRSVRLFQPQMVMGMYSGSLSLGMAQRIIIAIALSSNPKLLIADEPTSGLDTTNERRIIDLIRNLLTRMNLSLLFISHNIELVGEVANDIAVMYAGIIVEVGSKKEIFNSRKGAKHPYTEVLISSIPRGSDLKRRKKPKVINCFVPNNKVLIEGCPFMGGCRYAMGEIRKRCYELCPGLREISPGHFIRCHLY